MYWPVASGITPVFPGRSAARGTDAKSAEQASALNFNNGCRDRGFIFMSPFSWDGSAGRSERCKRRRLVHVAPQRQSAPSSLPYALLPTLYRSRVTVLLRQCDGTGSFFPDFKGGVEAIRAVTRRALDACGRFHRIAPRGLIAAIVATSRPDLPHT